MFRKNAYQDEAAGELKELMRHANALLEATAGQADEQIKKVRAKLEDRLAMAREKYSNVEGLFDDTVDSADRMVHDKPYQVIGGTFLVGLLLGWFLSRK
ncbi:protein of unknown function DUF883 ElaB [Solidesulfovibrio carbinoliphilus subsp. oakridgensis]|uniref:DUF883 domain-containing protein n=1 Tax=Solidesulfovibrio carbinoliphilus subsp. oakridgensis TaxID=694327 RepID=G7QAB2_9BACT|nr:DUF883 family protein [Solidesulfovibrio carbinoliphilus]EHJ48263.1 protein of unknown function DUF883 ElaB [Solidesulfovibrio carbinoliphilus subsp. oakridgensis]